MKLSKADLVSASRNAHDKNFQFSLKVNEAAINNANVTLRTALIINGGAAIALISFVGNLYSTPENTKSFSNYLSQLMEPLSCFSWGVGLAVLAMAFSYFGFQSVVNEIAAKDSSFEYPYTLENTGSKRWSNASTAFGVIAVGLGAASIFAFGWGLYKIQIAVGLLKHIELPL